MSDCGVYQIVRLVVGLDKKYYIGASRNLKNRMKTHLNGNTHNGGLSQDIEKHGIESFTSEVLLRCTEKELLEVEKEIITDYRGHGYALYNRKPTNAKHSINVCTEIYKELNKIRIEMSNIDPRGRIVTFNEVIKELLAEREEYLK